MPDEAPILVGRSTSPELRPDLPEKWAQRDWDRLIRERDAAVRRADDLARKVGLLQAHLGWAKEDREEQVRGLQRKVAKQARVIRRHAATQGHKDALKGSAE